MFRELLRPSLIIFSFALPAWIILRIIIAATGKVKSKFQIKQELLYLFFYLYIIFVFILTLVPVPLTETEVPKYKLINFIPVIHTLKVFLATLSPEESHLRGQVFQNIAGNIILFIPLGMFLPFIFKKMRSLKRIAIAGFAFSLCIELAQLFSRIFENYRTVDIDDIILNTAGAVIGFLIIRKWIT